MRFTIAVLLMASAVGCAPGEHARPSAWGGPGEAGASSGEADDGDGDGDEGEGEGGDGADGGGDGADGADGDRPADDGPATTSADEDDGGADGAGDTGAGDGSVGTDDGAGETTGPASSICDDVAGQALLPPTICDGPSGNTTTQIPDNDLYATSWFGCYMQNDGSIYMDPYDNCEFACGNQGLCPAGQDGPTCEANLKWFAADADRYGCGGRIRVTNCDNDRSVVLVTLDRGPNCNSVEMACDAPVLDMSHDAMVYLFEGGIYGGCDHQAVVVEQVDADTPLGPID